MFVFVRTLLQISFFFPPRLKIFSLYSSQAGKEYRISHKLHMTEWLSYLSK